MAAIAAADKPPEAWIRICCSLPLNPYFSLAHSANQRAPSCALSWFVARLPPFHHFLDTGDPPRDLDPDLLLVAIEPIVLMQTACSRALSVSRATATRARGCLL